MNTQKYALITGASSGIGKDFARIAAKDGYNLILTARNTVALDKLKSEIIAEFNNQVLVIPADLSVEQSRIEFFNRLTELNITPEILINNAGFGDYASVEEAKWEKLNQMQQLNMVALTHVTHFLLPKMKQLPYARILNVASVAAFMPGPLMTVYYATKAYVLSFSLALNRELKGSGVKVSVLCPGPTSTGFEDAANLSESKLFKSIPLASSWDVARIGYRAMKKGKQIIVPGILNKLMVLNISLIPRCMRASLVYMIQKK